MISGERQPIAVGDGGDILHQNNGRRGGIIFGDEQRYRYRQRSAIGGISCIIIMGDDAA